ncbi:MAG TPA: penicillin-binding protein 2 [Solirubrobacteraceae bacterium]|nr:penicillin-binding protein 2 [Solirubrobacteraceae bacterium]
MSTGAPRRTVDTIDRRVGLMFGIFVLLLFVGILRAGYLGTIRAGALRHAANAQQVKFAAVPAPRGEITDRNGVVYAISEPSDSVYVDPIEINKSYSDPQTVATKLAPLLKLTAARTLALITKPGTGYVQLAVGVPAATTAKIMKLQVTATSPPGVNGVWDVPTERRAYPRGTELAQVLGWADGNSGADGLESEFNNVLAGVSGRRRTVFDAQGKAINIETPKSMIPGKNMKLTISAPLQSEVEQVLAGVAAQYKPVGATAIVTDPQTDQVLALANWPSLNLDSIPSSALKSVGGQVPVAEDQAVDLSYEPGSTFKAVTVAGALQDGLVTPSTEFSIPPYLMAPGNPSPYKVSDSEQHGYEQLSVAEILKVSSNIGADKIGQRLGPLRFGYWVNRFGFGKYTGVALSGEQRGIILQPSGYSGASMYNLPFGQGESVTPMQMVQAYDAIADGGILRTPQIIDSIGSNSQPEPKGKRIISSQVAYELRSMLRSVLTDQGTASGAAIPGYDMAGKTGTAQIADRGGYSKNKFIASFIGMVPASKPKLVVAVVVDQPQGAIYGGSVAAPAFQKIVGWAVPHFGINPCPPSACPSSAMHPTMP